MIPRPVSGVTQMVDMGLCEQVFGGKGKGGGLDKATMVPCIIGPITKFYVTLPCDDRLTSLDHYLL